LSNRIQTKILSTVKVGPPAGEIAEDIIRLLGSSATVGQS
jgi:hypothetical protein